MDFDLPELDEIGYRLWRLRRLIVIGAAAPALVWLLMGLAFWPFTGLAPDGYVTLWIFAAVVLGLHALLFPNANEETLAVSLGLVILTLVEPFTGFSISARLAQWICVGAIVAVLPDRLVDLAARSRGRIWRPGASVNCEVPAATARQHFPPRPGQELPYRLCGKPDAVGIFPITLVPSGPLGFNGGIEGETGHIGPHVWARITLDEPGRQKTEYLSRTPVGGFEPLSEAEHVFVATPAGTKVTETEVYEGFPAALAALLWLVDYQQDGLIAARDTVEGRTSMALRNAPRQSIGRLVGALLRPGWAADRG